MGAVSTGAARRSGEVEAEVPRGAAVGISHLLDAGAIVGRLLHHSEARHCDPLKRILHHSSRDSPVA